MTYKHPRTQEFCEAIFNTFAEGGATFIGADAGSVLREQCAVEHPGSAYSYGSKSIQWMIKEPNLIPQPGWLLKKVSRRYQFVKQVGSEQEPAEFCAGQKVYQVNDPKHVGIIQSMKTEHVVYPTALVRWHKGFATYEETHMLRKVPQGVEQ
jgi:hypothetical protein